MLEKRAKILRIIGKLTKKDLKFREVRNSTKKPKQKKEKKYYQNTQK